jgi:Ser/Thr protein kinase RdoA (MazF antagonist)
MFFDKPVVLSVEIPEIASLFSESKIVANRYLGGVPNVTWAIDLGHEVIAMRICNRGYTSAEHLCAELSLLVYLESVGYEYSPRPVRARTGSYAANWRGYPVIATRLINGESGEGVPVTPDLCYETGQALGNLRSVLDGCSIRLPSSDRFDVRGTRLVRLLPETAAVLSWSIDIEAIGAQFAESLSQVGRFSTGHQMKLVHTDVWPPNTIVRQGHLVGIVDFDDLAFGPPILDLASAFAEFAIDSRDDSIILDRASKLLDGYRSVRGVVSKEDGDAFLPCIVYSYASWLACNALHQVPYAESEIYDRRLRLLRDTAAFGRWRETIADIIG